MKNVFFPLAGKNLPTLGLVMINLHIKFEISKFICYEDMKGTGKSRNSGGLRG